MTESQDFWGEEWEKQRVELRQVGVLSDGEKLVEDEGIICSMQVFKDALPDLFKQVKTEFVSPGKDSLLLSALGVFCPVSKVDDLGDESFVPTIAFSERATKINRELRKISLGLMADKFGLRKEELSDRFLRIFIFFHEVGHAQDYATNYAAGVSSDVAAKKWGDKYEEELATLPIPSIRPSVAALIYEDSFGEPEEMIRHCVVYLRENNLEFNTDYQNYSDAFFNNLKGRTLEQLLADNERAYRVLPAEEYADNFAAEFLKKNKEALGLDELKK